MKINSHIIFSSSRWARPSPSTFHGVDWRTLSDVFRNKYIYNNGTLQRNKTKAVTLVEDGEIRAASRPGNTTEEVECSEEENDGKQRQVMSLSMAEM